MQAMLVEIFAEIMDKFEQKNVSTWLNIENEFRDGKKFKIRIMISNNVLDIHVALSCYMFFKFCLWTIHKVKRGFITSAKLILLYVGAKLGQKRAINTCSITVTRTTTQFKPCWGISSLMTGILLNSSHSDFNLLIWTDKKIFKKGVKIIWEFNFGPCWKNV